MIEGEKPTVVADPEAMVVVVRVWVAVLEEIVVDDGGGGEEWVVVLMVVVVTR